MKIITTALLATAWWISFGLSDDVRNEVKVVERPAEDYLKICGWEFDVEGGGYSTCSIDLNGDGLEDRMFANRASSGTGGKAATIYLARKDGKFTRIGSLGHGAISAEAIKSGGRLLHCSWNFGGGSTSVTTYLLSHDGLKKIIEVGGEWSDKEFQELFDRVFETQLEPHYKFVAARPEKKTKPEESGRVGDKAPK